MDGSGYSTVSEPTSAFWHDAGSWSEADLPRRRWIAQGYLLRGALSVLVGSPGVSKSTLSLAWGVALALGQDWGRLCPADEDRTVGRRKRVLILGFEDNDDEQKRRLSALLRQFSRTPLDLDGRLMRCGPNHIGALIERDTLTGSVKASAGLTALEEIIATFKPDVLVIDPLIEAMGAGDENDNGVVSAALSILRALAERHQMAVLLVHHVRKGQVVPGDMDAARGASALIGKVRAGLTLTSMSEQEAAALNIPVDRRRHYLRLDDGKSSYAELGSAEWFERLTIHLDNDDTAPTLLPWSPPRDVISPEIRSLVEAGIARGTDGEPWSPTISTRPRSIANLMTTCGVTTRDGQKQLLAEIIHDGYRADIKYRSRGRKDELGLRSPAGEPCNVRWLDDDEGK